MGSAGDRGQHGSGGQTGGSGATGPAGRPGIPGRAGFDGSLSIIAQSAIDAHEAELAELKQRAALANERGTPESRRQTQQQLAENLRPDRHPSGDGDWLDSAAAYAAAATAAMEDSDGAAIESLIDALIDTSLQGAAP